MNTRQPTPPAAKPPGKEVAPTKPRIVELFADRYNIDPKEVINTLVGTAFKVRSTEPPATREELISLLVIANEYHLNPFIREIYAFRNKAGGITPIVGIDGWVRIVERQDAYEGEEMKSGYDTTIGPNGEELGFYYECFIHRSDRKFPISRRQYYKENYRNTDPWKDMPTRMLQHRAYIQSARAAFGLGGIFDQDEGEAIALSPGVDLLPASRPQRTEAPQAKVDPVATFANVDQIRLIQDHIDSSGLPENLVLKKFEVGALSEVPAERVADVIQFVKDNAP